MSRRLRRIFLAVSLLALGLVLPAFGPASCQNEHTATVSVTEGTNIAATVSPDGQRIILELQGALWSLPASGESAEATRITDPFLEPSRPHWSPAGDWVAFQAYAGGTFHIWRMHPDGTGLQQLTFGHGDDREPRFSPDGTRIAFSSDRAFEGSYDIWVVDVATGALNRWTSVATDEFEPDWVPGGSEIAYVVGTGATGTSIQACSAGGASHTLIAAPAGTRLDAPALSPDGRRMAYTQQAALAFGRPPEILLMLSGARVGAATDVFPYAAQWIGDHQLLYTANGKIQVTDVDAGTTRVVPFHATMQAVQSHYNPRPRNFDAMGPRPVKGIVGPSLSPDGRQVLFEALNQIWVMTLGERPRAITNDRYFKSDPCWSPDGRKIAYSSDKAGTEDLYIVDREGGPEQAAQRVTSLPGAEVSSAWSPDGRMLAFQDQTGATFTVEIATGNVRRVLPSLFAPSKPSWHSSGTRLAVAALKPYSRRFREGTSQILTVNVATGALTYTEPAPFESISTRGDDGPVYAPDGSAVAFVMQSALWIKPVDAQGIPTGEAVKINDEATDAPSWSGDSQTLLYLSNGKLRTIARPSGASGPSGAPVAPRDVPLKLDWNAEMPQGRTVIHAGRLWDGRGATVLTDVDIVVDGHRIVQIRPHDANAHEGDTARYIDASHWTVLPGLWESHTHQWISGKFYGDRLGRLWMAYGVTSLRSVGDPAYRAVETMEAFASGQRVGPRFFPTGEAIDGERVFYNFMRPLTEAGGDAQLARELSRAKALDYDMIKTYVRLPHRTQAAVAAFAHDRLGVGVASHYMPPVMAYGVDGMTHVSATTRLGLAYSRSNTGVSYGDMRDALVQSGMFVISTTFTSSLYADDPSMVDDPRLLSLNTPWDQVTLRGKRDAAVSTDQSIPLESLRKEEDTVRSILAAGGTVLAGTDSPLDDVATALHLNLRAQVKLGGVPPWRALQTATKLSAEAMAAGDDLGTVERGKLADFAFVEGNPLERIEDVAKVRAVMKNGKLYPVEELMAPFSPSVARAAPAAPAAKRAAMSPSVPAAAAGDSYWWHNPENMIEDD